MNRRVEGIAASLALALGAFGCAALVGLDAFESGNAAVDEDDAGETFQERDASLDPEDASPASEDGASGVDAGRCTSPIVRSEAPTVACGDAGSCRGPEGCCVANADTRVCRARGDCENAFFACDDTADCPEGRVCCVSVLFGVPIGSSCSERGACPAANVLCARGSECECDTLSCAGTVSFGYAICR